MRTNSGAGSPSRDAPSKPTRGGSGHLTVRLKDKVSQLPMHGGGKELGTRLVEKIKKDLGLK